MGTEDPGSEPGTQETQPPRTAALFISCVSDLVAPGPARAVVEVLEAMGVEVRVPSAQTCCGQPALNAGHPDEARALVRHWLGVFEPYDVVVTPSGSCAAMLHHHVERLVDATPAEKALVERTYEFTQFVAAFGAGLRLRLGATVTYHDSCHMARTLGERWSPREVLGRIEGLRLVEMPDCETCCGFGGTFAAKFPEVSVAMADTKLGNAAVTEAELLVSADPGCLMHLQSRAQASGRSTHTRHIAELVRDALVRTEVPA
jgi:L-lactate dehydrogenase complex protein LldE